MGQIFGRGAGRSRGRRKSNDENLIADSNKPHHAAFSFWVAVR